MNLDPRLAVLGTPNQRQKVFLGMGILTLVILLDLATSSVPVMAGTVTEKVYDGDTCEETRSSWETDPVDDPDGFGVAEGHSISTRNTFIHPNGCLVSYDRPAAQHAAMIHVFYAPQGQPGAVCYNSGWRYSTTTTSHMILRHNMGSVPDCGEGWYATFAFSAHFHNGEWRPAASPAIWSGWEYHQ